MSNLLTPSVICPILIGRSPHLATINRHLNQAQEGRGQTLLIAGEAGLGKSRLVAEITAQVASQGWLVLSGHCYETEAALPYAPIIELLRAFNAGRSPAKVMPFFDAAPAEFVSLLPELAAHWPHLPASVFAANPDKYRLFQAMAQFCAALAAEQPLLLIIEDLHWCDEASLELLLYLARRLTTHSVILLLTFRSDETGPELTHFLAQLDRGRLAAEIALSPLTREQVDRMLQAIFNQPRPTRLEFLETLYALTEGNPFFIEETLKSMVMAGDIFYAEDGLWDRKPLHELRIPRSVQDAVQQRRRQLSANAQQLLTLAAVVGRHFDFTLLQRLTGHTEAELLAQFKELMAAQFITEASAEQFAFRHALTREAIYTTLLARERRHWHQRIAETLEQLPNPPLADLSYHFYRGEVWDRTLVYAQQAGERALKFYAPQAAITHFSHALQAAPQLSAAFSPQLFYQRGQAYATLNNFEAALADYQAALEMSMAQNNHRTHWQTLLALGNLWATRDYARSGDYFQQAQALAQLIADPPVIAQTLNTIGNWQMNRGRPFAAVQSHQEALAIFKSLNDPLGLAQTLDYLAISSYNCADITQSRTYYHQAVPLWEQLEDYQGLLHSLGGLALGADYELAYDEVPVTQAIAWGEQGVQVARRIGWRSGEAFTLICWGMALRHNGQWGLAIDKYRQALAAAEEIEHSGWTIDARLALGIVYLDLLALSEARPYLEETLALARQFNAFIWINYTSLALAEVYIVQQAFDLARARLDELLPAAGPMETLHDRFVWLGRAELSLAQAHYETALEIVERLITTALKPAPASSGQVIPRLWLVRGLALNGLGRLPQAESDLLAGLETAQAQRRVRLLWRLYAALAQVYLGQGKIEPAEQALAAARANIEALAGSVAGESLPRVGALGNYFIRQATAMLPSLSPSPPKPKSGVGGLTPREREVAVLVAQGQSNREIAEILTLSERTAERHVANIMNKLGFNSRAQIAAWAVEKGLTSSSS